MWLMLAVPEADDVIGGYRHDHDPYARFGVPAHVTVRKPFLPPAEWDRIQASEVLASLLPVEITLARIEDRPGALVIAVEPDDSLRELTAVVTAAWPELPPHKENRPDLAYHVTVVRTRDPAVRASAIRDLKGHLPLSLTGMELWAGAATEHGYTHRVLVRT